MYRLGCFHGLSRIISAFRHLASLNPFVTSVVRLGAVVPHWHSFGIHLRIRKAGAMPFLCVDFCSDLAHFLKKKTIWQHYSDIGHHPVLFAAQGKQTPSMSSSPLPSTFVPGFHCESAIRKMRYNRLGCTDMVVSVLGHGGGAFGGCYDKMLFEDSKEMLLEAGFAVWLFCKKKAICEKRLIFAKTMFIK